MTPRCALRPSGRCLRQRFLADARIEPWSKLLVLPAWEEYDKLQLDWVSMLYEMMVVGEGFEPSKSMTADLQSAPFGRSGTPPGVKSHCRLFSKMNGGGGRITRRYLSSPFGPLPAATFSRWRSSRTLVEGSYPSRKVQTSFTLVGETISL